MSASFTKTLSEADVKMFAGVTGDFNPLHAHVIMTTVCTVGSKEVVTGEGRLKVARRQQ